MKKAIAIIVMMAMATAVMAGDLVAEFGSWRVTKHEQIIDGSVMYVAMLDAEVSQGTLRTPRLAVRLGDSGLDVLVMWGGYSLDRDAPPVYVVLDGEYTHWEYTLADSMETLFLSVDTLPILLSAEVVAMQVDKASRGGMVARWQLAGMGDAVAYMQEAMAKM